MAATCVASLGALHLRDLPAQWVSELWDANFCDVSGPERVCCLVDMAVVWPLEKPQGEDAHLAGLVAALKQLKSLPADHEDVKSSKCSRERSLRPADFWVVLVENQFTHRGIIAALFYFMEAGGCKVCTWSYRLYQHPPARRVGPCGHGVSAPRHASRYACARAADRRRERCA
jgi:hypothetical protein